MKIVELIGIDNLKCGGCANTIQKEMSKMEGAAVVRIDLDTSCVEVEWDDTQTNRDEVMATLGRLGYPEAGTSTSLQKAKSFLSCMIGRVATS